MGRVVGRMISGAAFGDVLITDQDFADDAVILAKTIGTLTEAITSLSEGSEALRLRTSWTKT